MASVLTPAQCDEIRTMYASAKWTQAALARRFHCGQSTISRVVNSGPFPIDIRVGGRRALLPDEVRSIRRLRQTTTLSQEQIAAGFGVCRSTVSNVLRGYRYSDVA